MHNKSYLINLALGIFIFYSSPLGAVGENAPELDKEGQLHITIKDAYKAYQSGTLMVNKKQYLVRAHRFSPDPERVEGILKAEGNKVLIALPYGKAYTIYHTKGGLQGAFDAEGRLVDKTDYIFSFRCEPLDLSKPKTDGALEDSLLNEFIHIYPPSTPLKNLSPKSEEEDSFINDWLEDKPNNSTAQPSPLIKSIAEKIKKLWN